MSISNTGDVGIGTTSPANNLQVKTSSDGGGITIQRNSSTSNAFADLMFSISTSDSASPETKIRATRGASYDDTDISFITSNTEKMRISSAGNVGIGTDSPTATLHVESADDAILRLKSTDNKAYIALSDNDTNGYISSEGSKLSLGANLGVNANNLNIDLANNRVGIGVSSPGRLLTLSGSASPYLSLVSNTTGGSPSIFFGDTADDNEGRITYSNASDYMALFTAATERIRINSSGNVGIGVSSPASKLEVDGGDIEIDDSASGLILRSPDGTRYRVTVADGGAISASAV